MNFAPPNHFLSNVQ